MRQLGAHGRRIVTCMIATPALASAYALLWWVALRSPRFRRRAARRHYAMTSRLGDQQRAGTVAKANGIDGRPVRMPTWVTLRWSSSWMTE